MRPYWTFFKKGFFDGIHILLGPLTNFLTTEDPDKLIFCKFIVRSQISQSLYGTV